MRIFITGINGFVGRLLHKHLLEKGFEVFGTDIGSNSNNVFSVDITQFDALSGCINKIAPDIIYHLAAISKVDYHNSRKLYDINVNGTINLLDATSKLKNIPKFILISSSQVYGIAEQTEKPIPEICPVNPVNHYGASKAAAENIALAYSKEYEIPLTILRPFNHIGVDQNLHFFVPKIVNAFKKKIHELKLGNIKVIRDFLDVRDVVDVYTSLIDNFSSGDILNIASGKGIYISEIIDLLEKITGHTIKIFQEESLLRTNEITHIVGDSSKLMKKLNWTPKYSLTDTLNWMLKT